jgi:hypothetical protein
MRIASPPNAVLELGSMLATVQHYLLRSFLIVLGAIVVARALTWLIYHTTLSPRGVHLRNLSEQRATTLRLLVSSLLHWVAGIVASLLILGMFVPISALLTALGLFSAAISLSAMNYVKDFFGGVVLLFEDEFAVGDKVQLGDQQVSGVVERVTLRATTIRGEAGDLWIVPNGEVRTIRNFTRGAFSPASLRLDGADPQAGCGARAARSRVRGSRPRRARAAGNHQRGGRAGVEDHHDHAEGESALRLRASGAAAPAAALASRANGTAPHRSVMRRMGCPLAATRAGRRSNPGKRCGRASAANVAPETWGTLPRRQTAAGYHAAFTIKPSLTCQA